MLLLNRVAIITGGAKGIGKGIALKFAEEGCDIVIADVSLKESYETLNDIRKRGRDGIVIECDITDINKIYSMVNQVISKFKKIDILVNNAGILGTTVSSSLKSVATLPEEEWDKVVSINLKGAFLCSKEVVPYMKQKRYGKIINMSSIGAIHPPAVSPHYTAAKAGVLGLTYDMACELGPYNIWVNAIMPGTVRTTIFDPILQKKTEQEIDSFFEERGKMVPLQRVGVPEDIAGVALFLASELSSYVTGLAIPVAGGRPLQPTIF